jgi:phage terminase large subunit
MVVHRRGGKTVSAVNEAVTRAIYSKKQDARYAYIAPFRNQAKDLAWTYLRRYTEGITSKVSESELSVTLAHNDARVRIYGADNPDSFRGIYLDGVVIDEYGDMSPIIWGTILLPTLMDRKGWAVFIGTFKGRNHFWKTYERSCGRLMQPGEDPEYFKKNWYSYILPASKSTIYTKEEFDAVHAETEEEEWQQEYECNPDAAVKGTYYAKLISILQQRGQIYDDAAEYNPDLPVGIFSDIGRTDSSALWFYQRRPGGYALIDYEEFNGQTVDYYAKVAADKPYSYDCIWVPHDAKAKTLQTKRSTIEQLIDYDEHGYFRRWDASSPLLRLSPRLAVQHGIDAVRSILPDCFFSSKTEAGVEALRAYRRRWDDITKSYADDPNHDWASHGADGFRYFALGVKDFRPKKILGPHDDRPVVEAPKICLDDLWADRRSTAHLRERI